MQQHSFLVKHLERFKYHNKWMIVLEYIDGVTLRPYIKENFAFNQPDVLKAIELLAKELRTWHNNGFALGDPHLDNAMLLFDENGQLKGVKLLDYSQIHHKDFTYCKKFNCFHPTPDLRIKEDLNTGTKKIGCGFLKDLQGLEKCLNAGNLLSGTFITHY